MGENTGDVRTLAAVEAIRRRPSLYIGPLDDPALLNRLIRESLCLAVDEAAGGHCTEIRVEVRPDGPVRIRDNGRGLPTEPTSDGTPLLEKLLTKLFAGRDHKENPGVGAHCCVAGLVVTNALSERLVARNFREGVCWVQEYRRGKPSAPFQRESETVETGLEFTFHPDKTILGPLRFDAEALSQWLKSTGLLFGAATIDVRSDSAGETVFLLFERVKPPPRPS